MLNMLETMFVFVMVMKIKIADHLWKLLGN